MLRLLGGRCFVLASVVCAAAFIGGVTAALAARKPTASELLQKAFVDASAAGSVHEVQSQVSGGASYNASDDISLHDGQQHITRTDGIDAHVLLIGPVAYISGNQQTLVSYFGLSKSVAHVIGARWVRIPSSDHGWYPTVAADATLPSALTAIKPSGHVVELPPSELDGEPVVGIRGNMPAVFKGAGTDTIFITRTSHPMLVAAVFADSGKKITSTFTNWGERVTISAPGTWIASNKV